MIKFFLRLSAKKEDLEHMGTEERAIKRLINRLGLNEDPATFKAKFDGPSVDDEGPLLVERNFEIKEWPLWFFSLPEEDQYRVRKRLEGINHPEVGLSLLGMWIENTFYSFFLPELVIHRKELTIFKDQHRTEIVVVIDGYKEVLNDCTGQPRVLRALWGSRRVL